MYIKYHLYNNKFFIFITNRYLTIKFKVEVFNIFCLFFLFFFVIYILIKKLKDKIL